MTQFIIFLFSVYVILRLVKFYLDSNPRVLKTGLNQNQVSRIIGPPLKKDPKITKEKYVKEIWYYIEQKDNSGKTQYKFKVTYIDGRVSEIQELQT